MSKSEGGHRYASADAELAGFFTAALGVIAQGYENNGVQAFLSCHAHAVRILAIQRGHMRWYDRVEATLLQLPAEHRRVLELIYRPHAWPTWLASELATPWGGGSMVALAATLTRATDAAGGGSAIGWLVSRGRGGANDGEVKRLQGLFRRLREDAEGLRMKALAAYDILRIERVKRSQANEREVKAARERANADRLATMIGQSRAKSAARFTRRGGSMTSLRSLVSPIGRQKSDSRPTTWLCRGGC